VTGGRICHPQTKRLHSLFDAAAYEATGDLVSPSQSYSRRLAALSSVEPEFQVPPLAKIQKPYTPFRACGFLCF